MNVSSLFSSEMIGQKKEPGPEVFFESVLQTFHKATQDMGTVIERFYRIHDRTIRLCFAGDPLIRPITPALAHLATVPTMDPHLTIYLWDDASTHTTLPSPPWTGLHLQASGQDTTTVYTPRGDIRGFKSDHIYTAFHMGADVLTMLDTSRNLGVYWTRYAAHLPSYESRSPLRTVLHLWLRQFGIQYVHAGAVGSAKGGVLLAGKSGSGKSTTAITCLNSELGYASDDYCLVTSEPSPYAFCLYNSAKVNGDNLHRVSHLIPAFTSTDPFEHEKATYFLHEQCPDKLVSGFPIRAVLLPRVTGRTETCLKPATTIEGLQALALSTMAQLAEAGPLTMQLLKRFVSRVPCYHLELGTELNQIPEVIIALLENEPERTPFET
jgi:hypothetical protein